MLKLISVILVILGCFSSAQASDKTMSSADSGINSFFIRGDEAVYEKVERRFIDAAKNSQDDELIKLISPLTKRDSSEIELKSFAASMKEYFSDYASDLKCKSIVPNKDEYGNVGFFFYNAFKRKNGSGRAYVMALIKEKDEVYVATVFRKFDERYHERCREKL
ncbi:hypothetical protein [Chromobacterium sphagni]|uniref:hypothetical protein n=1 Tax=Chromobacterium sphagni TaxID=1903179 RepID=UPI0011133E87|nr:hypothetical protein [Chromobacterium sphagni]